MVMHCQRTLTMSIWFVVLASCMTAPIYTEKQSFVPRVFYGARFELPSKVLHGAGQDILGFTKYCAAVGPARQPVIYMTYVGIAGTEAAVNSWAKLIKQELQMLPTKGVMLQIGLPMTTGKNRETTSDAEVADGSKDANIEAFCKAIKGVGVPVFVRIGHEFEGGWNRYKPQTYKAAYVRITKALRAHNLDAATVWCSAGPSEPDVPVSKLMDYYPGDDWVDWWGIDIFSKGDISDRKTVRFCNVATEHRKPVMIGESTPRFVGVLDGKKSWNEWFAPYFQLIRSRPEIKAFCYINWEWKPWSEKKGYRWHTWGDCRIEENEYVTEQYRKELDLPLYEHVRNKS